MKEKILLIEDDINIINIIKYILSSNSYDVECFDNGKTAIEKFCDEYSCVLLDIMLPGASGFEILKEIRKKSYVPVIMLTASGDEDDKVKALDFGADDYITKPFSNKELVARVNANIRRNKLNGAKPAVYMSFLSGRVKIDADSLYVYKEDEKLNLTAREFELLKYMYENKNVIFSRDELLSKVWGYKGFIGDARAVDVTIKRLRDKIEPAPSKPEILMTKRSVGYYLDAQSID